MGGKQFDISLPRFAPNIWHRKQDRAVSLFYSYRWGPDRESFAGKFQEEIYRSRSTRNIDNN
jgi:hypothetical protein